MGFFAIFNRRLARRRSARRLQPAPLCPQRLERRRVLDAGAAGLLLGSLAETGETVQVGENLATPASGSGEDANLAPANVELFLGASEIYEDEVLQLGVAFDDPNEGDTHKATIDWGDGTPTETFVIDPGARFLGTSHRYLDDNPTSTSADLHTIKVSVFDAAGQQASATAQVMVKNVAPTNLVLVPSRATIFENQTAELVLRFEELGTLDTHTVEVDWGDGSAIEQFDEVSSVPPLLLSHQYLDDDPTATLADVYQVKVTVTDDDGGESVVTTPVRVLNVPPLLSIADNPVVDEGALFDLTTDGLVSFVDMGTLDTYTATVEWGDGTPTESVTATQTNGLGTLDAIHRYADNGVYTVKVVLNDDDGGIDTRSFQVTVNNVTPELVLVEDQTVDEGAVLQLTNLGTFTDPGFDNLLNTQDPSNGGQTTERFFYKIDWGDTTLTNVVPATIDQPGGPGVATRGSFDGSHIYADNGLYTVTVQLIDDDSGLAVETFQVLVTNVPPTLEGVEPVPTVDEGSAFTLAELGATITDPGFDNPFNPLVLGGSQETFTSLSVDWGDGTSVDALSVVNRVAGSPGVATTAEFEHAPHTYADNGLYTVTLSVGDDDGGLVLRTFQIQVNNVAPTLVLTDRELEISEGETLDLFDLGTFFDPGFDNPLNTGDPSNGGEVTETFSYTIDWGDGTVETGSLPATVLSGSAGVETLGTLVDSHLYLDNDLDGVADNLYTITVTLSDDDGGLVAEQIIVARVLNVDPTLEPITATDVNTKGETTLTIEFSDPGTEVLTVWVDWGDKLALPPAQRYVPETVVLGPGTHNLTLQHVYAGPPDPLHPAADIILSVFIRDDDFGDPVVGVGQSETRMVAISNPGAGVTPIVIDTTPQVPRLVFPQQDESTFFLGATSSDEGGVQTADLRTAVGDTKSTTDRFLELRVIDPASGEEGEGYRLKSEVLNDLPGLFRTLPDNHYAIYLVRTETNTRRLVIEVYVRNGKLIDPGDDSEGTRDRPPTDEATKEANEVPTDRARQEVQPEEAPILKPAQPEAIDVGQQNTPMPQMLLGTTLVGFVASKSGRSWAERIDRAVATADSQKWHRLRRTYPHNRKKG